MIRIEFWNGQLNKKGKLVRTKHNPCLWSDQNLEEKPWRSSYVQALEVLDKWFSGKTDDETLLHDLRYVAYSNKDRNYDNTEVIWWGNMTVRHKPQIVVQNIDKKYTIYFNYVELESCKFIWKANIIHDQAEFYWDL